MHTLLTLFIVLTLPHDGHDDVPPGPYAYDEATVVEAELIGASGTYEPCVLSTEHGIIVEWLEHDGATGDRIVQSVVGGRRTVAAAAGRRAAPTITSSASGELWASWEEETNRGWDLFLGGRRVNDVAGAVEHRTAAHPGGDVVLVWRAPRDGQYDVFLRRVGATLGEVEIVADTAFGEWHPDVAVAADGTILVVWDAFTGTSFDVRGRLNVDGRWQDSFVVASGSRFQARPTCSALPDGRFFVAWEEGSDNWGRPYTSVAEKWNNVTDAYGPVHSVRTTRCGFIGVVDRTFQEVAFPMPSLELARARGDAREDAETVGVFYERPEVAVDGAGRPWVVVRHYFAPQVARPEETKHHVEEGWFLYARGLTAGGWSGATMFDVPQRDGNQRLSVAGTTDGVVCAWGTGRTDRRKDPRPRGVAMARAAVVGAPPVAARGEPLRPIVTNRIIPSRSRPTFSSDGGATMTLVRGDLHRHTDLSLCFPFYDGSLNDAYRYAIEVARLDFLGITDHTRDLDHGDALSQLWHRCQKEVTRHDLGESFVPYFAYERSHRDTDHNVITLRTDIIEDFQPPLPEFWAKIDRDTFTIPHNPFIGKVWRQHDDLKRPLLEIYQGFRDQESDAKATEGLAKGYHLGIIASSDHLSTSASYACVWTPAVERKAIFRSMQARRTFGATCEATLTLRTGDHWMGERITVDEVPKFQLSYEGTAAVAAIEWVVDGVTTRIESPDRQSTSGWTHSPQVAPRGEHHVRVKVIQADGHRAWSSPIWFTFE